MAYKNPLDQRAYAAAHYRANKPIYQARRQAYMDKLRAELRAVIWELKSNPCMDCGGKWPPYVMQFDHLPGKPKRFNIADASRAVATRKMVQAVLDEIECCDLVCANCHALRTWQRMHGSGDGI